MKITYHGPDSNVYHISTHWIVDDEVINDNQEISGAIIFCDAYSLFVLFWVFHNRHYTYHIPSLPSLKIH
jgi:hypothetical protein